MPSETRPPWVDEPRKIPTRAEINRSGFVRRTRTGRFLDKTGLWRIELWAKRKLGLNTSTEFIERRRTR